MRVSVRKPRLPKLTPRIGDVASGLRDARRHAEQRAVAAEDDDQIDVARQAASRDARLAGGARPACAVSVVEAPARCRGRAATTRARSR